MQVTQGSVVSFNYKLTDDEGNVLDSNEACDPLTYLHGYDNIIPGLERALDGVDTGYKSEVVVEPADAYGEVSEEAIFEVGKDQFPEGVPVEPGMQFVGETESGDAYFVVTEVNESGAVVDANHPLAGKTLHFDVEIVDVRPASAEELELGHPQAGEE
jgi:FKBP-type peptidyl-prolyl cis-trans isomerase SlyD